jgi:hypothetical protein
VCMTSVMDVSPLPGQYQKPCVFVFPSATQAATLHCSGYPSKMTSSTAERQQNPPAHMTNRQHELNTASDDSEHISVSVMSAKGTSCVSFTLPTHIKSHNALSFTATAVRAPSAAARSAANWHRVKRLSRSHCCSAIPPYGTLTCIKSVWSCAAGASGFYRRASWVALMVAVAVNGARVVSTC